MQQRSRRSGSMLAKTSIVIPTLDHVIQTELENKGPLKRGRCLARLQAARGSDNVEPEHASSPSGKPNLCNPDRRSRAHSMGQQALVASSASRAARRRTTKHPNPCSGTQAPADPSPRSLPSFPYHDRSSSLCWLRLVEAMASPLRLFSTAISDCGPRLSLPGEAPREEYMPG